MENSIQITVPEPAAMNFDTLQIARRPNLTIYLTEAEDDVSRIADPDYEQFLADVWVGVVLTLMVLSCVCCMCSCLLYHKFQQWKMNAVEARRRANNTINHQQTLDSESLPSYTIVSGLPSYDEALEQLRKIRETSVHVPSDVKVDLSNNEQRTPQTPPVPVTSLSVLELFQIYKTNNTTNVPLSSVDCKT